MLVLVSYHGSIGQGHNSNMVKKGHMKNVHANWLKEHE